MRAVAIERGQQLRRDPHLRLFHNYERLIFPLRLAIHCYRACDECRSRWAIPKFSIRPNGTSFNVMNFVFNFLPEGRD